MTLNSHFSFACIVAAISLFWINLIMPGSYKCPFGPLCAPDILFQLKYLYISEKAELSYIKIIFILF